MTTTDLTEKIGIVSVETVKKICREIKQECDRIYDAHEVEFIIHKNHGVRLLRYANNAQHYSAYIYTQELVYELFTTLFFKPTTYTEAFCEEQHVSTSSVRRKIKEMNAEFKNYGIQFSIATDMKVHGAAQKIRCAAAFFSYTAHRQLSAIPTIEDPTHYLQLTKQIGHYLNLKWTDNNIETFSLFIFATECSHLQGHSLSYPENVQQVMAQLSFPKKPSFLAHWHDDDWKAFVLALDIFSLCDLSDILGYHHLELPANEADDAANFCEAISSAFLPLDASQRQTVYIKFMRFFFIPHFLPIDEKIMSTFNPLDFDYLKVQFPIYVTRFDQAFEQFTQRCPMYQNKRYYYETLFTLCTQLWPLEMFKPVIYVYHYSDYSFQHKQLTQQFIKTHFTDRVTIQFVDDIDACDFVIGDVYYAGTLTKPFVLIRIHLYANDLRQIEHQVIEVMQQRAKIQKSELL